MDQSHMNEVFTRSSDQGRPDTDLQRGGHQSDTSLPQGQRTARTGTLSRHYWRVDEVADYFAISTRTVYRLLDDGALQTIRIRSCRRVAQEEVRRFEKKLMDDEPF